MKKIITILKMMVYMSLISFLSSQAIIAQGGGETAGNNLSFPVIFADGGSKVLPGTMEQYLLNGEWWYVWGEDPADPQGTIYSCKPSEANENHCENTNQPPGDGNSTVYKAYVQKDVDNVWQAYNTSIPDGETLIIDWVDWGDNLESVAWDIDSKVRTELVLLKDLDELVTQFGMRHVSGWGSDEVHGMQTQMNNQPVYGEGTQATVYTPKLRFTVQKLNYTRESIPPSRLTWDPEMKKWTETNPEDVDIINDPIYNQAAFEAGTGSGYFSAEINVKGKIIYGYTWDVNSINDGEGHYRITYSFDEGDGTSGRAILGATTQIVLPIEEEATTITNTAAVLEEPSDGGVAILDPANNLTYMDVLIGQPGETLRTESFEMETFYMYPNPVVDGMLNIKNINGSTVTIYSMFGHLVFTSKLNASQDVQTLDLSALHSGMYFVKVSDGRNTTVKKLILK
ncbi:MAG: hypothetical protein DA407_07105 [Bacteroidetes bacterium]|nr:MAG: hypothetical protein DA407_07105 [Bacteroidota bacterium]